MGTRKWFRLIPLFVSGVLLITVAYLIATRPEQVIVITPQRTELKSLPQVTNRFREEMRSNPNFVVPRGQSFFYSDEFSNRLGSFEVWRPRKLIQLSSLRENYWKKSVYRKKQLGQSDVKENIFVVMITNSNTMWKNIPTQQQTMFRHFTHYGLYGNVADSIGGKEVVDVLSGTSADLRENSKSFETYRVLKTIRDSHANIGPEEVELSGVGSLRRFTMLPALLRAYKEHRYDHEWFVITDDDTTIFDQNLREALDQFNSKEPLYLGSAVQGPKHIFASSGSVIVLSREAMRQAFDQELHEDIDKVINEEYAKLTMNECCGDYILAAFLKNRINLKLDIEKSSTLFQGLPIRSVHLGTINWCSPVVSLGLQRPRDMELVAEYEAIKAGSNEKILYSDIYLDFVKPFIYNKPQQNWDNGARDVELQPGSESLVYPDGHKSLERCQEACEGTPQCIMFRYDAYRQYCGLGVSVVALGSPVLTYKTPTDKELCKKYKIRCKPRDSSSPMSSMWMIDRIKEMRRNLECDILHRDRTGEGVEYGALDQTEGWWHRLKD